MSEKGDVVGVDRLMGLEIRAQPAPWWHGVELFARARNPLGGYGLITDVILEEQDDHLTVQPLTISLGMEEVQVLMDDLWASGVRPSDKRRDSETLGAVREHLEDMQKIAFRLLDDKLD